MSPTLHIFVLLLIGEVLSASNELVPVYMWQTTPTKGLFPAMAHINQDTFKEILLQKQSQQDSKRIVVFAEPNLSSEDFSDRNTFEDLFKVSPRHSVTYLPMVVFPVDAIKAFAPQIKTVSLDDVNNNPTLLESELLIITLNDAQEDEDRAVMLKRHCKFIAEAYEKITESSEHKNVIAVYTGSHSSWFAPNAIRTLKRERRATEEKPIVVKTAHFLMYSVGHFTLIDAKSQDLTVGEITENKEDLTIQTIEGKVVKLEFKVDDFQNWVVHTIKLDSDEFDGTFFMPMGFSYSCSSNLTFKMNAKKVFLSFPTFQIQYFPEGTPTDAEFYDSYDCMGFTSVPIWSGLFVTFILAIIMSIGLTMIMDIKTMDRFDDPKGKTIIINAVE